MTVGNNIREARKAKGWDQKQFAKAMNVSQGTVSDWERGKIDLPWSKLERISEVLGVNVANYEFEEDREIYDEGGNSRLPIKDAVIVHMVGYVGGDEGFMPFEDSISQILEAPAGTKAGTEAVEVWGNSMAPAFPAGTVLYYSQIAHPIPFYIGRPVIVKLTDGRKLFKYLQNGSKPGQYSLQSGDGTTIANVSIETVFPIDLVKF